ncbi:hypothetical protein QN277_022804 [Acacia crassicarpa]|uniref:Uncharacterized protein n=1 Tax=Acacia crassicarpa TaxID=499986 RepID=A0AAE1MJ39_9FABA|nr:hypothetical protein QN277_022804 [Acacia crassicarpa]
MVRRKIEMKRIENKTNRQLTFSKRRNGLLKKAFELSVLCDVEVALIIYSAKGKLSEFSSSSLKETIDRYQTYVKDTHVFEQNMQHLNQETASMKKKIEFLEASKRKFTGEGLNTYSQQELEEIEREVLKSVRNVRARKNQIIKEQMEKLEEKEKTLTEEYAWLSEKCGVEANQRRQNQSENISYSDVDTGLFIGLPETGSRNKL